MPTSLRIGYAFLVGLAALSGGACISTDTAEGGHGLTVAQIERLQEDAGFHPVVPGSSMDVYPTLRADVEAGVVVVVVEGVELLTVCTGRSVAEVAAVTDCGPSSSDAPEFDIEGWICHTTEGVIHCADGDVYEEVAVVASSASRLMLELNLSRLNQPT